MVCLYYPDILVQVMWWFIYFFPHKEISTTWKSSMVMQHKLNCLSRTNNHHLVLELGLSFLEQSKGGAYGCSRHKSSLFNLNGVELSFWNALGSSKFAEKTHLNRLNDEGNEWIKAIWSIMDIVRMFTSFDAIIYLNHSTWLYHLLQDMPFS